MERAPTPAPPFPASASPDPGCAAWGGRSPHAHARAMRTVSVAAAGQPHVASPRSMARPQPHAAPRGRDSHHHAR
ncbi:hypothetical protein PSPO01_09247 [Paraphaeosphaeria sporulosa]